MKKLNILFCNHQSSKDFVGGAEFVLLNIAATIDRKRFNPFFLSSNEGKVNDLAIEEGIPVRIIEHDMLWDFLAPGKDVVISFEKLTKNQSKSIQRIKSTIENENIDLVVSNCLVNFIPLIAAKKTGVPTILLIHEIIYAYDSMAGGKKKFLMNLFFLNKRKRREGALQFVKDKVLEYSNKTVFVSDTSRRKLFSPNEYKERVIKLNPPLRREIFNAHLPEKISFQEDIFSVVFLGILVRHKGVHDFIKAAIKVSKKIDNIHFSIAGGSPDPDYYKSLKQMIKKSKMDNRMTLVGFLKNPLSLYDRADIICMTSLYDEPFGAVVTEGMLRGKTILTYNTGSIKEIIHDGINGFIIPRGDINALADKIIFLEKNRHLMKTIGENARKTALEKYNPYTYVAKFQEMVEAAVEGNK
ncbi:MAG: glycosyltransferase family 4 protein [Candidatus Aminicenantes bacterium]|nr:glycosyltransferase family 4 protein [Candidatus Aminicenantes bacterium]